MIGDDDRTQVPVFVHVIFDDHSGGMWSPWTDRDRNFIGFRWVSSDGNDRKYLYLVPADDGMFLLYLGLTGDPDRDDVVKGVQP